jgi:uncharacterized membrane protein
MDDHNDTNRLEAFSDGVFAIAITLLILEIGVPHVSADGSLWRAMRELWPSYLSYTISFVVIGIMWMNHHNMFRDIVRTDHYLLVLNLLLLMCISFLPFPTAVLSEYMRAGGHRTAAVMFYGATFTVIAIAWNALWLYASHGHRLLSHDVSVARVRIRTRRNLLGPIMYGITIPLALISLWISIVIYAGLAVLYLLPQDEAWRTEHSHEPADR